MFILFRLISDICHRVQPSVRQTWTISLSADVSDFKHPNVSVRMIDYENLLWTAYLMTQSQRQRKKKWWVGMVQRFAFRRTVVAFQHLRAKKNKKSAVKHKAITHHTVLTRCPSCLQQFQLNIGSTEKKKKRRTSGSQWWHCFLSLWHLSYD